MTHPVLAFLRAQDHRDIRTRLPSKLTENDHNYTPIKTFTAALILSSSCAGLTCMDQAFQAVKSRIAGPQQSAWQPQSCPPWCSACLQAKLHCSFGCQLCELPKCSLMRQPLSRVGFKHGAAFLQAWSQALRLLTSAESRSAEMIESGVQPERCPGGLVACFAEHVHHEAYS